MVAVINVPAYEVATDETPSHEVQQIGPDLTLHTPWTIGQGRAYVLDWRGNGCRQRAPEAEDFWVAEAVTALAWQREVRGARRGAVLVVAGWEVRRALRSDGRWRVCATRMNGDVLDCLEFEPDLIDFAGWLSHLC